MYQKIVDIKGMHCGSCELLIEEEMTKIPGVKRCKVNYRKGRAEVLYEGNLDQNLVQAAVEEAGYSLGKDEKHFFSQNPKDYLDLGMVALALVALYYLAQALGIFQLGSRTGSNYNSLPVVFLIGLTAGLSTCMAIVGGLILGASARFAEKHPTATTLQKFKPHLFFNLGRIASYTILGGVIAYLGSFMQISTSVLGILIIIVGIVMLLLGIQLTEIIPGLNRFKFTMPKQISRLFGIQERSSKEYSHKNSFITGALTFFLPCGFTQAMQLYAISTGKPLVGALTLGVFAIGTAPGLLGIGGLTSIVKGAFARHFFKGAGIVVAALAVFNISNGYNLSGFNLNVFQSFTSSAAASVQEKDPNVEIKNGIQIVNMTESSSGYEPNSFTIQKDMPVRWIIDAKDISTCANSLVSSQLGIRKGLQLGENVIEFTPNELGTIRFSCIMGMYTGQFNVVERTTPTDAIQQAEKQPAIKNTTQPFSQPISTPAVQPTSTPTPADSQADLQIIKATYSVDTDVQPNRFTVKADKPVRLEIQALDDGQGCMGSVLIPGVSQAPQILTKGQITTFTFTPKKGTYNITCAMGIPRGEIVAE